MNSPDSFVVSSIVGPVSLPPLVEALRVTENVVAGWSRVAVAIRTFCGISTKRGTVLLVPRGMFNPTVLTGVKVMSYCVISPLGTVGLVQETMKEVLVWDTRETTPTPDGAIIDNYFG